MTLVLAAGNKQNVVLASDRRITSPSGPTFDELGKSAAIVFEDARLAWAFAGTATIGKGPLLPVTSEEYSAFTTSIASGDLFLTHLWIPQSIVQCAPPDYTAEGALSRFAAAATARFESLAARFGKRYTLSVVFAGSASL